MRIHRYAAACGALALFAVHVEAKEIKGHSTHPADYPVTVAENLFADIVKEKTGGRFEPKVYAANELGQEPAAFEQIQYGAIDFGVISFATMNNAIPATRVPSLPFVFKSEADKRRIMDGPVGKEIAEAMSKAGVVPIGWYSGGARSFYTVTKPIKTPADMAGMKIRVLPSDVFKAMIAALGAEAAPMALNEVGPAMQAELIDGAENNWPSYESTGHYKVAKFYSLTEHVIVPEALIVSKKLWDTLSPEDQEIFRQAGKASTEKQWALWDARDQASRKKVEAEGAKVNEVDKKAFSDRMAPVYAKFASEPDLAKLLAEIQAAK
jgi:TRAP-type transport system periplasmic protein